jgi:hypothetical protein
MFPFIQSTLILPPLFDEEGNEIKKQENVKSLINLEDIHTMCNYPCEIGTALSIIYKTIDGNFLYQDNFLRIHQELLKFHNWKK